MYKFLKTIYRIPIKNALTSGKCRVEFGRLVDFGLSGFAIV
jgi:hypothetical protein